MMGHDATGSTYQPFWAIDGAILDTYSFATKDGSFMLLGDNRNGEGVRVGVGNPKLAMT